MPTIEADRTTAMVKIAQCLNLALAGDVAACEIGYEEQGDTRTLTVKVRLAPLAVVPDACQTCGANSGGAPLCSECESRKRFRDDEITREIAVPIK